jgi:DNA-directed RNA polymerase subunit RPC12/RpoP
MGMAPLRVECLRCGDVRDLHPVSHHRLDGGECPRCRYVGWAASAELDEWSRRLLRERPPAVRRVRLVA